MGASWVGDFQEVSLHDGKVRDRFGFERGGEVAVDFEGRDRLCAGGERARERTRTGADLDELLIRLRRDRLDDLVDPDRLQEVLAEALAGADHSSASARQYCSSISSISSSLIPK